MIDRRVRLDSRQLVSVSVEIPSAPHQVLTIVGLAENTAPCLPTWKNQCVRGIVHSSLSSLLLAYHQKVNLEEVVLRFQDLFQDQAGSLLDRVGPLCRQEPPPHTRNYGTSAPVAPKRSARSGSTDSHPPAPSSLSRGASRQNAVYPAASHRVSPITPFPDRRAARPYPSGRLSNVPAWMQTSAPAPPSSSSDRFSRSLFQAPSHSAALVPCPIPENVYSPTSPSYCPKSPPGTPPPLSLSEGTTSHHA